ncbi:phosphoenolpyruvate--protein phosphotransferase, partial [Streptomyces sp. MS2A]|nr:phosphoenolpyruvate--protein phosphotransferase [Streptomyces sp. MS2A]
HRPRPPRSPRAAPRRAGASLDAAAGEASGALLAKTAQLADPGGDDSAPDGDGPGGAVADGGGPAAVTRRVTVRNPLGIHARPAALIAEAAGGAEVRVRRLPSGPDAAAASLSRLLTLGARAGDEVELTGPAGADDAVERIAALFQDGFGEVDDAMSGGAVGAALPGAEPPAAVEAEPQAPVATPPAVAPPAPGATLRGRGVSAGRAGGPVVLLAPPVAEPPAGERVPLTEREAEAARIGAAADAVVAELADRASRATGDAAAILDATRLLAADPETIRAAGERVRAQGISAERAVWEEASAQEAAVAALGGRMAERAADLRDVRDRIIATLEGRERPGVPDRSDPFVLVASDLAPADTAALAGGVCVALVTEQGGPTSHTAIIARSLGLPAVVGAAGATAIPAGRPVLVDGEQGTVRLDPSAAEIEEARGETETAPFDGDGRLADGTRIGLRANVGGAADAEAAAASGADGVGLFRTEFLFLDRRDAPSVAEQTAAYRAVLRPFAGRTVVVRTLDAGSDKPLPFATALSEENPALGVRGLRVARRAPGLLRDQLRAIADAAKAERTAVDVMAPMVATIAEAEEFVAACREAGLASAGVMIETPSAALLAPELLRVVDFVSLGTNDLAQYTMAADRQETELAALNDPWQPAVLRLIRMVGEAGRSTGRPVGVCGEAAADPLLAPVLVGLGATSLSMSARALAGVSASLRRTDAQTCRRAADAA